MSANNAFNRVSLCRDSILISSPMLLNSCSALVRPWPRQLSRLARRLRGCHHDLALRHDGSLGRKRCLLIRRSGGCALDLALRRDLLLQDGAGALLVALCHRRRGPPFAPASSAASFKAIESFESSRGATTLSCCAEGAATPPLSAGLLGAAGVERSASADLASVSGAFRPKVE
jgi:hypothetical protein